MAGGWPHDATWHILPGLRTATERSEMTMNRVRVNPRSSTALAVLGLLALTAAAAQVQAAHTEILDGDTPGIHRPDFSCFDYHNLRRPVYPLDEAEL